MRLPLLIVDTETTGLLEEWSRIVEVAAVVVDTDGRAVGGFTSMVRPDVLDQRADAGLAINHISREDIAAAPSTAEVAEALAAWLQRLNMPNLRTTAYNAPFDKAHCARAGFALPPWDTCVMQAARKHFKAKSLKLRDAAERCGIQPFLPAHRALSDAQTAAAVAVEILLCAQPQTKEGASADLPPQAKAQAATQDTGPQTKYTVAPYYMPPQANPTEPIDIRYFGGAYSFLSNFFPAPVGIYDTVFPSVEHAFQAMKGTQAGWSMFLSGSPGAAKRLGRSRPLRPDWEAVKVQFMQALVYDKFHRTPDLGVKLKATGRVLLYEGNTWHDNFWGGCSCASCAGIEKRNELGRILMAVREALFQETPF